MTREEKLEQHRRLKEDFRVRLKTGGFSHEAWVERSVGFGDLEEPVDPVVNLANHEDGFYMQTFRNRDELELFVSKLVAAADEAWPI